MRLTPDQARELQRATGRDLGLKPTRARASPGRRGARDPQAELLAHMQRCWGDRIHPDYVGAVPGRKFELDMAFIPERLGVEVDGWQYHGKFKSGFQRDREKRNLLLLNGWGLLTFSARDVFADPEGCLVMVARVLENRNPNES